MGVLQVDPVSGDDRDFRKMDTAGQRMGFEKAAASADQALDILDKYVPEKKSVFSALEGRKVITTEMEAAVRKREKSCSERPDRSVIWTGTEQNSWD